MIGSIRKFFSIVTQKERRKFYLLIFAMVFMGFTEIAGIGSISPFLSVVTNPDSIETNELLNALYTYGGFSNTQSFVIGLGIAVLAFIVLRNLTAAAVRYVEIRFAEMVGYRLSKLLMAKYLGQPYVYFLNRNSAELSRNVLSEASAAVRSFLVPLLELMTKLFTIIAILTFLIILDPAVSLMVAAILGGIYGILYLAVKKVLFEIGKKRLDANRERFQVVNEAFGGIKDVKLLAKESVFLKIFSRAAKNTARYQIRRKIIGSFPKYALDTVVFGSMIAVVISLIVTRGGEITEFISILGVYIIAAYRLMPALDAVFKHVANIRGSQAIVDVLAEELGVVSEAEERAEASRPAAQRMPFTRDLALRNIFYTYPGAKNPVIAGQSLTIKKNTTVGFVGPTGCGKTTLVDIILGLLRADSGELAADGAPITEENLRSWQANMGYVPQSIYLCDDSVANNIAFGVPSGSVDMERVVKAAEIAHLDEFIRTEMPQGYDTPVGEKGIRLSGGQRQRIGIARALYNDPEILVLDEATSALDNVTERIVMEAIEELSGKKTIILIAHRLSTLRDADAIFLMKKGEIIASGSYDELLESNKVFQKMAKKV